MKLIFSIVMTVLALSIAVATPVLAATWWGGNYYSSAYGVKSDIYTPSSAPDLGHYNGESSWVDADTGDQTYWIQTGWRYNGDDYSNAYSYTEAKTSGGYMIYDVNYHSWNSSKNYKVVYDSPYWRCYINDSLYLSVNGGGLPTPPTYVQAQAEVHESSSTELYTWFYNVQYLDAWGTWHNFFVDHLDADYPYSISGSTSQYLVYGP